MLTISLGTLTSLSFHMAPLLIKQSYYNYTDLSVVKLDGTINIVYQYKNPEDIPMVYSIKDFRLLYRYISLSKSINSNAIEKFNLDEYRNFFTGNDNPLYSKVDIEKKANVFFSTDGDAI